MHTRPYLPMAIAIVFLSLPSAALAQNAISLTAPSALNGGDSSVTINLTDCQENFDKELVFSITFDALALADNYKLYRQPNGASCPTDYDTGLEGTCELLQDATAIPSGTATYNNKTLAEFVDDTDCAQLDGQSYIFRVVTDVDDDAGNSFDYTLRFATEPADNRFDSFTEVEAGQSTITVSFTASSEFSDDESFTIYYATTAPPSAQASEWRDAGASAIARFESGNTINDLKVGETYYLALTTVDGEGNESELSAHTSVKTEATQDFFELYDQGGGEDGCEASQAGSPRGTVLWAAALFLLLLGAAKLRRRQLAGLLTVAAVAAVPLTADAQLKDYEDSSGVVEVHLGSYLPEVDEAVNNSPYKTAFGESMFLFELELDKQLWRGVGTFGVAMNLGYMSVEGRAQNSTGDSPDKTEFNIIPLRLGAVYRFDYLAQKWNIPIAVALKGGLDLYTWWITAGDNLATSSDRTGEGITYGYHYAAGFHLLLDWFDESSADGLSLDFGVINSYLFAEVKRAEVDDFGDKKSIRLSDTHYSFGLAFEY